MHGRDLQQRKKMLIWNPPQEMDPCPILIVDKRPHLGGKDVFPALPFRGTGAVADIIATHNKDSRLRPPFQYLRQGPHEDMITAVRLQIPVYKGNDLVIPGQVYAVVQGERCCPVRGNCIGIYPVMDNRYQISERFREGACLPVGG